MFLDLAQAVVKVWDCSGSPWQAMVDRFRDALEAGLAGQPQAELCRPMHLRLYQKHKDFELHCSFTHGNEEFMERAELLRLAVWARLCREMGRQYVEPRSFFDYEGQEGGDAEKRADAPKQLALPF